MPDLHFAACNGDDDAVRWLLAAGALVDERDGQGHTPLLWACFRAGVADYVPVIKTLVGAGADIEAAEIGPNAWNCLMLAVQSGSRPAVETLLALGAAVNASMEGMTALMVAARRGDTPMARLLLRAGADPRLRCGWRAASDYADYYGYDGLASELMAASRPRDA